MEYTVKKLAQLAGVSSKTLRFYDEKGLLKPARITSSGYRIYGSREVELLRQILIYRSFGLPLAEIAKIVSDPAFNPAKALEGHLSRLLDERKRLDLLIGNVEKSIQEHKGMTKMTDSEKFEGLKQRELEENERRYGAEIRERYGEAAVEESNRKFASMSREDYDDAQRLSDEVNEALKTAVATGNPSGPEAMKACGLHKDWLCHYWPEYSADAHAGLGRMYVADERFKAYYDNITPGAAEFLRDALEVFTNQG